MTMFLCAVAALVPAADPEPKLAAQSAIAWPEFRGPTHEGHTAGPAPLEWSDSEGIVWQTPLDGLGWSSPTVDRGLVVLTTAVAEGESQSLRLQVVDFATGELKTDRELFRQDDSPAVEMHQKNSHASPTPVLARDAAGRTVCYAHFGPHGTAAVAIDDAGRLETLWSTAVPAYLSQHGTGGSPALHGTPDDGTLVVCCDGRDVQSVVGLDAATGELQWQTPREAEASRGFSFGTPLLIPRDGTGSGRQAICPGSSAVMSLDPDTGEELWRVRYGEGYSVVPRPVYDPDLGEAGLVFVCSGFGDKTVYAIDPTGSGDVTDSHVAWSQKKQTPMSPSLLLHDGLLYSVSDRGIAFCREAATGEVVWTDRLGGNFSASPLLVADDEGDRIYWQDESGVCTVTAAGREAKTLATNRFVRGKRTFASYALVDGDFLIRTESALLRVGR